MIAASDPQEFVPSGRQQAQRHPGPSVKLTNDIENKIHLLDKLDAVILDKLEKVSLTENQDETEWWILRKSSSTFNNLKNETKDDKNQSEINYDSFPGFFEFSSKKRKSDINISNRYSVGSNSSKVNRFRPNDTPSKADQYELGTKIETGCVEEELYVKGHTVIWSKGITNSHEISGRTKKTVCAYTSRTPIKQALWCNFYLERPSYNLTMNISKQHSDKTDTIQVPSICIVDCQNIKVFTEIGEDFEVAVPFPIKKVWNTAHGILIEKQQTGCKDSTLGGKSLLYSLAYPLDDVCTVAVNQGSCSQFLSNETSQVVFTSENPSICVVFDSQTNQHIVHKVRKVRNDERDYYEKSIGFASSVSSSIKLKNRLSIWNTGQDCVMSPIGKVSNTSLHRSQYTQNSMAAISRCQSLVSSTANSPQVSYMSSFNQQFQRSELFDTTKSFIAPFQFPTICLDYVWSQPAGESCENRAASKIFICDDLTDQSYFCYLGISKLYVLKADFSNPNVYSFGASNSISCKDAVPLPHLHMMAILEFNGNVTLYSGLTVVGKLHLDGTLVKHTPTPQARRIQPQFLSPFPRRSSLLPNSNQNNPQFDENLFSPVLPTGNQKGSSVFKVVMQSDDVVNLIGLRDAVENRMTLEYSDGTFYRVKLPLISTSPLVENCLKVLKQCLQRDVVMVLLTKWYSSRHSIGTQNSTNDQEWEMFTNIIYELLGFQQENIDESSKEAPITPSIKKAKQSLVGSNEDWNFMIASELNKTNFNAMKTIFKVLSVKDEDRFDNFKEINKFDKNSSLYPYVKLIHFSLHLLYEDYKLDTLKHNLLKPLAKFLNKLTNDLKMYDYTVYYWNDFPEDCYIDQNMENTDTNSYYLEYDGVLDIMKHIGYLIKGKNVPGYPHLRNVNEKSKTIVQLSGLLSDTMQNKISSNDFVKSFDHSGNFVTALLGGKLFERVEDVILLMTQMKVTTKILETLPFGLYLYFYNALWKCRENPPPDWPSEAYLLIWREDLAAQSVKITKDKAEPPVDKFDAGSTNQLHDFSQSDSEQIDGMEDIDTSLIKLRFPDDVRVLETRKMLQSSKPVPIVLVQRPDISDHDFIEEQEKHLYAICTRTMALPVGRGMFTLRTATPLITKPLAVPPLCLTGKAAPRGTTVELTHIDTPSNMSLWPLFHNGVANGLRISPGASNIDNTWIVFNKPKGTEKQMEHGGFLYALGLHGHLRNLDVWNTYNYLSKSHEMISVGILLGLSCAFRGTGHTAITKMLSIHVEALLPPTSMELDLSQQLQVTALLGVGLLYQSTGHIHMTEVLLSEIGRPPGPEMENSTDRESYSLAAGLALGLVTLQRGGKTSLADLNVSDMLYYYMTGGTKRPLTGAQRDKYKVTSFQIREGSSVNLDVTAPGATLALGLMYMGTKNKTIADWMSPPETQYLLDFIRPDFLMLRIISKSLILWDDIESSTEWVENQVPKNIRPFCMVQPSPLMDVDYEAMNQAYCNIITGACFAIGLRYAGSADEEAFKTLLHYCHVFISLTGKSISELAGKPTIETCLNVLLLSVSMVMAGTGNIEVMRLIRHLRKRVGISSSAVVTYGSHLAIHMALGLLFLGGGRYTLSNSPSSVAALICAFYPKFPTHSNDNRYHLQALRHLYVLAAETRLLITKDVYSGKSCYANLKIVKIDGSILNLRAPAMLPDLDTVEQVSVADERYWEILLKRNQNWAVIEKILGCNGFIEVKQRAGCLSYTADKFGYLSQFARTLTQSKISPWSPSSKSIRNFTSNESIRFFCDNFLSHDAEDSLENNSKKVLTKITYDAVVMDKLIILSAFAAMKKMVNDLSNHPNSIQLQQFKLVLNQVNCFYGCDILSSEVILAIKHDILNSLESWEDSLKPHLQNYIMGNLDSTNVSMRRKLSAYVTFFDIPFGIKKESSPLGMMRLLGSCYRPETVDKLLKILKQFPEY